MEASVIIKTERRKSSLIEFLRNEFQIEQGVLFIYHLFQ